MRAIEQYFHVVLFTMLYKVVLTFMSVDETLVCDHSNKSYWAVLSCGTVYYAVQGVSNLQVCGWNPSVRPFRWKLLSCSFVWCYYCCNFSLNSHFWLRIRIVLKFVCHILDVNRLQHKLDSHPFAAFSCISSWPLSPVLTLLKLRLITNIY